MDQYEPGEGIHVALYIRSLAGDPEDSLIIQLRALQSHAAKNGMKQVRAFFDPPGSRSQFMRMMAESTGGILAFRRILVAEMGRFAPASGELAEQLARLRGSGVTVESITEPAGEAPRPEQPELSAKNMQGRAKL